MQHRGRGRQEETQRDGEERKGGGKWWKNHSRCRDAIGGDPRRMLQSVSISNISGLRGAAAEGGRGVEREGLVMEGEADDVKSFELFRRPLHRM